MVAAVEPLELWTEIIRNICDCKAAQPPAQRQDWEIAKRPQVLSDIVIAGCVAHNGDELSGGNAECAENCATNAATDLILTDSPAAKHSTRDVDHAWKHA